jgi:hypothetical protein
MCNTYIYIKLFYICIILVPIYIYIQVLAYFPGVAWVFIYPNLIVICVPSLTEIAHVDGIFSIITSTLLAVHYPYFPGVARVFIYPNLIAIFQWSIQQ